MASAEASASGKPEGCRRADSAYMHSCCGAEGLEKDMAAEVRDSSLVGGRGPFSSLVATCGVPAEATGLAAGMEHRCRWVGTWRALYVGCAGTVNAAYDGVSWRAAQVGCAIPVVERLLRPHLRRRRRPSCP